MSEEVTREEYEAWRRHRAASWYFSRLECMARRVEASLRDVADQAGAEKALALASRRVGIVEGLEKAINLEYEGDNEEI